MLGHTAKAGKSRENTFFDKRAPSNMQKQIMKCILCALLTVSYACEGKPVDTVLKQKLLSNSFQTRIETIRRIGEQRHTKLKQQIIDIILKKHKTLSAEDRQAKEEKYIAAKTLAKLMDNKEALLYYEYFLKSKHDTLKISALHLAESLLGQQKSKKLSKKQNILIGNSLIRLISREANKKDANKVILQKSARILGIISYAKAYNTLLQITIAKRIIIDEIIITLSLLGHKNKEADFNRISALLSKNDNRTQRALIKARYIINSKENYKLDNRLLERLADLASDVFTIAYDAENYFKLFKSDTKTIKTILGKTETSNPKKIKLIVNNRLPLLAQALYDKDKQMQFKAIKILEYINDQTTCSFLQRAYTSLKDKDIKRLLLRAIANINCEGFGSFIEKNDDEKGFGSPLFIYLTKNKTLVNTFFRKYPLMYSNEELLPIENKTYIKELLYSENKQIRINTIYAIYKGNIKDKNNILQDALYKEKDKNVQNILKELVTKPA